MAEHEFLSLQQFPGDGVTTDFAVNFAGGSGDTQQGTQPYINITDVVAVEIIPASPGLPEVRIPRDIVILGPLSFRVTPAVATGRVLELSRNTWNENNLVDFRGLQAVSAVDLDTNSRQLLFVTQEAFDKAELATRAAQSVDATARQAVDIAMDALDTADGAVSQAETATDIANAAAGASALAVDIAESAVEGANEATGIAMQAEATADSAVVTANAAAVLAGGLSDAIDAAVITAEGAEATANDAAALAGGLSDSIDAANTTAAAAVATANSAQSTAEGLAGSIADANSTASAALDAAGDAVDTANTALDIITEGVVLSFNGRTGAVVPEAGDYNTSQITGFDSDVEEHIDLAEREENVTFLQDGATPGTGDSTAAVTAALNRVGTGKVVGNKGPFNTTNLVNILGRDIDDSVQVINNGKLYNTYAHRETVWGMETLFGWFNRFIENQPKKIVFSGDSTTAGHGMVANWQLPNVVGNFLRREGFPVTVVNRGQFGETAQQWNSTRVAQDIAEAGDLYVVRWGLNDPHAGRTLTQYATELRGGLAKLRAAFPLSSGVGIVLMTPNSTDDPGGVFPRTALWHEEVVKIHRRAARDYGCAFIDTYGLFQNSEDSGDKWMDAIKVHPKENFNLMIGSAIIDLIAPDAARVLCSPAPVRTLLPLTDGWVADTGVPNSAPMYYKDRDGRVHLSGRCTDGNTTAFSVFANLPEGFRPHGDSLFSTAFGLVSVASDGRMGHILNPNATSVAVDGISFLAV